MGISRIPMPQNGMDAFLTGMTQSQSIFDSLMKNRMSPYQIRLLEAQTKEAEAKANAMPAQMKIMQQFMGTSGGNNDNLTGTNTPGTFDKSGNATTYNTASNVPNPSQAPNQDQQNISNMKPGDSYVVGSNRPPQNAWGMNKNQLVNQANQDQAASDQQNNVLNPAINPKPIAPQAPNAQNPMQQQPVQKNTSEIHNDFDSGKEVDMSPGDPSKAFMDKIAQGGAGLNFNGMSAKPEIKRQVNDGIQYTYYPSGRVTKQKIADTTDEKEQKTADRKISSDLETTAKSLLESGKYINNINDINQKKVTSGAYALPGGGLVAKFSKNKDLGNLISDTSLLQASYAKAENTRAGIGLVNFFKNTKPDISNSPEINQGMLEANAQKVKNEFNLAKQDWERKNPGKQFPYQAPDFSRVLTKVTIVDSNGKTHPIDRDKIDEARKIDPGLKVMEG